MKTNRCTAPVLLLALAAIPVARAQQPMTRAQFADAMHKVKIGMTADEVTNLLGKPDDVQKVPDRYEMEYWNYGTDGHDTLPTLGSVLISEGAVDAIMGGDGTPPDPSVLDEKELRKLLHVIDSAAWGRGTRIWNGIAPLPLIRVVNTLQPLGKEKGMAALGEYVRVTAERYKGIRNKIFLASRDEGHVYLLLRLLYEIPDTGFMPSIYKPPLDEDTMKAFPRFPLALVDDIPLCLAGRIYTNLDQNPQDDLDYFQKNGKWRAHPLQPSDDPLAALDKLMASPAWKLSGPGPGRRAHELSEQLLLMIDSTYPLEQNKDGELVADEPDNPQFNPQRWAKIEKEVAALHIRWDAAKGMYVRGDGTTLPPPAEPPVYVSHVWWVRPLGADAKLKVVRATTDAINIITQRSQHPAVLVPDTVMKVYRDDTGEVIAEFHVAAEHDRSGIVGDQKYVKLPGGVSVHMEYTSGGETTKTDSYTP